MAHRDLNEKSIPLTSYPSLASAPPQGLVYAQPVAQPVGRQVPYAQQPAAYEPAQVYQPYTPGYIPAAQPVYAPAQVAPEAYEQPVAQPVSVPQSYDALKAAVKARSGGFHYKRYIGDAHRFTCKNFCKLLAISIFWGVLGMAVNCGINKIVFKDHYPFPRDHNYWNDYPEPNRNYWNDYPEPDFYDDRNMPPPPSKMPTNDQPVNPNPPAIEPINPPATFPGAIEPVNPPTTTTTTNPAMPKDTVDPARYSQPMMVHAVDFNYNLRTMVVWGVLQLVATTLLWMPAAAGMFLAVFNAIRTNSKIKFRDFFRCFCCRYYCRLLGLSLVLNIVRMVLYPIFIFPGVWWTYVTLFALPLHKEFSFLGVCGSIRISITVIHRYFCQMLCFLVLLGLLQVAGFFCMLVGLFYTVPLAFAAFCFCFDDLIGLVPAAPLALPQESVTV